VKNIFPGSSDKPAPVDDILAMPSEIVEDSSKVLPMIVAVLLHCY
jgi:hypothetical protein